MAFVVNPSGVLHMVEDASSHLKRGFREATPEEIAAWCAEHMPQLDKPATLAETPAEKSKGKVNHGR